MSIALRAILEAPRPDAKGGRLAGTEGGGIEEVAGRPTR